MPRLLVFRGREVDHRAMTVIALPNSGRWVWDARDRTRALRVSAHPEQGLLNVSVWRDDVCVGTVKLRPDEVSGLVAALSDGLARLVPPPSPVAARDADVVALETRLAAVESRLPAPVPPVRVVARAVVTRVRGRLADLIRG